VTNEIAPQGLEKFKRRTNLIENVLSSRRFCKPKGFTSFAALFIDPNTPIHDLVIGFTEVEWAKTSLELAKIAELGAEVISDLIPVEDYGLHSFLMECIFRQDFDDKFVYSILQLAMACAYFKEVIKVNYPHVYAEPHVRQAEKYLDQSKCSPALSMRAIKMIAHIEYR
jgi:hypothetical protein